MQKRRKAGILVLCLLATIALSALVFAANNPTAPYDFTPGANSTFNPDQYGYEEVEAYAGNITFLQIHAVAQTKSWQGYWGNITGAITLDDADNYTFYNWSAAEPRGEIYATLMSSGIDWAQVWCFNFSGPGGNGQPGYANWSTIESYYNIDYADTDGVNETYVYTNHPYFQVGSKEMRNCPTTYIFRDDQPQTNDFVNVLLYEGSSNPADGWIYVTMIENKSTDSNAPEASCYNGQLCDFQILVNEDGHGTDTAATPYYFWVELD